MLHLWALISQFEFSTVYMKYYTIYQKVNCLLNTCFIACIRVVIITLKISIRALLKYINHVTQFSRVLLTFSVPELVQHITRVRKISRVVTSSYYLTFVLRVLRFISVYCIRRENFFSSLKKGNHSQKTKTKKKRALL